MKLKIKNILKPICISFSFIIGIILFSSIGVKAANSTDLYYPDMVLADSYNSSGEVNFKETIDVYAYNNGAGYQIDNTKVRISQVKITNGDYSKIVTADDANFSELISVSKPSEIPTDLNYNLSSDIAWVLNQFDKITINIAQMGISASNLTNSVSIELSFQQRKYFVVAIGWEDYDKTINTYKGGTLVSTLKSNSQVDLYKTGTTFASSQLSVSSITLSKSVYNLKDFTDKNALRLTIVTSYSFNGYINVYYSNSEYVSLSFSNSRRSSIDLKDKTFIKSDVNAKTYTFNKFTISGSDLYGTNIAEIQFSSEAKASFTLDTRAPKLTSSKITANSDVLYDVAEVYPTFRFDENVKSFKFTYLKFNLLDDNGGILDTQEIYCDSSDTSCHITTTAGDREIKLVKNVSGYGNLIISGFSAIVEDMYGNTSEYGEHTLTCALGTGCSIKLISSVLSLSNEYSYYYNGDTIDFVATLSSSDVSIDEFSSIQLTFSDDTVYKFTLSNSNSVFKDGDKLHLYYPVSDKVLEIKNISLYKNNGGAENVSVYSRNMQIYLNTYFSLAYGDDAIVNPVTIDIYDSNINNSKIKTFDSSRVSLDPAMVNLVTISSCAIDDDEFSVNCNYNNLLDQETKRNGRGNITILKGAITLSNGMKNDEDKLAIVINNYAPNATLVVNDANIANYANTNYYKSSSNVLKMQLNDVYGDKSCLYYKFNDGEYTSACKAWSESVIEFNIELPSEEGVYTLKYYVSDGLNSTNEVVYQNTFTYKNSFITDNIDIKINDKSISSITSTDEFNHLNIAYSDSELNQNLLDTFSVEVRTREIVSKSLSTIGLIEIVKEELGTVDDLVDVVITLKDKLGNQTSFDLDVNLDTVAPDFSSLIIENTKLDNSYVISISGYRDNAIGVKVDGVEIQLNNYSFTTEKEKYSIILTDKAGNASEREFTTVPPAIELFELNSATYDVTYEINISPFVSSIHTIEDYRYLVFDYTLSDISDDDIEIARNNICTSGRKVNCYIEGSYQDSIGVIEQTFTRGYTYILQIRINNILVNDKNTGKLPRLHIIAADTSAPVGGYLDQDINPDYVSSLSSQQFKFSFVASDSNLLSSYYYLVVKSSIANRMNVTYFYDLYKSCYGATSATNSCGIRGENTYVEEISDNNYLGEVIIESNYNTKRRFDNATTYSLFVLLTDANNNATLFRVREFANISESSIIEYYNDLSEYEVISNGGEVTTVNTTKVRISSNYDVDISSIKINEVERSCASTSLCTFDLGVGKHVVEVVDILGNTRKVTIYSAIASNPVIYVHYNYNGEWFRILDNSFTYNTTNAANVYVKVVGNGLSKIEIGMNTKNIYQSGNTIFDSLTDTNSQYGMSLLSIMELHNGSEYSDDVSIVATNENGGETEISLVVDNEKPVITLALPGAQINMLGELSTLNYTSGKYQITFNYQRDITYAYLMNALSLKVDGIDFEDIIEINRFKFKVDNVLVTDYDASISKGTKVISIDYFDNAGNVADTIKIEVTSIDNEAPIISLTDAKEVVELNTYVNLAKVMIADNHDLDEQLTLSVKINGNDIDYTNYKFIALGEYQVVYTISDTSSNTSQFTQNLVVKDTIAPTLKQNTTTNYDISLGQDLEIDIPTFVDSDYQASEYKPHKIQVLDMFGYEIDPVLVNYPLSINGDKLKINFNYNFNLGTYKVVFIVKDSSNNGNEAIFEFNVKDTDVPVITIKINDNVVEKDTINTFALGSNIVVSASAYDGYDGNLDSRITQTIRYDSKVVRVIDTSKNGDYIIEFTVSDSNDNLVSATITIRINKDLEAPVINKVYVNDIELLQSGTTKINGDSLNIVVDASDDCTQVSSTVKINDTNIIKSGESISIESDLSGEIITLQVIVKDSSGNETMRTYSIIVDNKNPDIIGVDDGVVYSEKLNLTIQDDNIAKIDIYKDNILSNSSTSSIENFVVEQDGLYRIVALDSYGNATIKVFALVLNKKFNVMDSNNTPNAYDFDYASLVETTVSDGKLTFILSDNKKISNSDRIYILVKYPNSNYKYVAYSMNGETYLANNTLNIETSIIDGVDNSSLLEKVGDKYYSYVMIVKDSNVGNTDSDDGNGSGVSYVLKQILLALLIISAVASILILIIKLRRRVRAV